jgi:hypothetical protein
VAKGMSFRRLPLLVLVAAIVVLVLAQAATTADPPPPPAPTCSPGPSDCGAWHTSNVTVNWAAPPSGVSASGCGATTISNDTAGASVSCTWSRDGVGLTRTVTVRRDATPPSVTASADRGTDANGWFNHPVNIAFSGSDKTSGISSCTTTSYKGPDTTHTSVPGSCTDGAGNTSSTGYELKYDATPPSVQAKPDRNPNARGWYNRPVTVAFVGTDPTAGVDSCAAPILYKGPDSTNALLSGTCRDKAANTSPPIQLALKYDTRPPNLARVKAELEKKGVTLRWFASKDSQTFEVERRPGLRGPKPSKLYEGPKQTFVDQRVKAGVKYRYTIAAYDEAGNASVKALLAQPNETGSGRSQAGPRATHPASRPALVTPAEGARLAVPPRFVWKTVPSADYYNLQLYRGGRKILSVWPAQPGFRVQHSWTFGGRTYVLTPGRYRWYVWPGFGARASNRYGKLIGTRTFVVKG